MRLVVALLFALALAYSTQGKETGELAVSALKAGSLRRLGCLTFMCNCKNLLHAGTSERLLAQDSTPLALNITLVGVTVIKPEQADLIRDALLDTLPEPKPSQAAVSSNTAIQDTTITLIILVYPPSGVNSSSLQASLEALDTSGFSSRLNALQLPTTSTRVNKVTPQPQNQYQRDPLTGASLAGQGSVLLTLQLHCVSSTRCSS